MARAARDGPDPWIVLDASLDAEERALAGPEARWTRSDDDDDDDDGAREDDASASKFSTSSRLLQLLPRVDDVDLLVGDVVVLWLYSLTQKVASVAASSSFPGWLARVSLNPSSLSSWLSESGWIIATWTFTSTCLGAYAIGNENARAGSVLSIEDGEMREAVLGAAKGWAAWSVPAAAGLAWLSEHQELHTSFPLGTELGCVLGVMISWRAYVKVIGLMGWWREGRTRSEREEEDWKFFFDALAAAAVVAVAGGVLDFVLAGGGEWGGRRGDARARCRERVRVERTSNEHRGRLRATTTRRERRRPCVYFLRDGEK